MVGDTMKPIEEMTIEENQALLIEAMQKRIDNLNDILDAAGDRINELEEALRAKQKLETVSDRNYWKGIEKAHIELHDQYFERIVELERLNAVQEERIYELEEKNEKLRKKVEKLQYALENTGEDLNYFNWV